jgi:tellurium resistance protein TerZ
MISLSKGQTVNLEKSSSTGSLTKIRMGLGWDAAQKKSFFGKMNTKSIDLDASCILFDSSYNTVDTIWFNNLISNDGSVVHTGDNLTGEGDGDDESIIVNLPAVPANVTTLVFTVNSFTGQDFSEVENAFCRVVDASLAGEPELARYDLSVNGNHTGQIMVKITRAGSGWDMTALGSACNGRTVRDLTAAAVSAAM